LALAPAASAVAPPPNLVTDPSFESPNVGAGQVTFNVNEVFGGWSISGGSVDLVGTKWKAALGRQSLDMNGTSPGSLYQSLHTTQGQKYRIAFALAGNPDCGTFVKVLRVYWGGAQVGRFTFDTTGHTHQNLGWVARSIVVQAGTGLTQILFASGTSGSCGAALDDVLVTPTT